MKITFRFRYNILFLISMTLGAIIIFQQREISKLMVAVNYINDSIPTRQQWREHTKFMNRRCDVIEIGIEDVRATASTAFDISMGSIKKINNDKWMIGKTTEEISRILMEKRIAKREEMCGGEK